MINVRGTLEEFVEDVVPFFYGKRITYVDVGAYKGEVYKSFQNSEIKIREAYLFEPNPNTYTVLKASIAGLNVKNVHTHNIAMGRSQETLKLKLNEDMSKVVDGELSDSDDIITVKSDTLDCFFNSLTEKHISLLKIDVEGFELDVLEGAKKSLAGQNIDMIYIEAGMSRDNLQQCFYRDIDDVLAKNGYKIFRIYEQMFEWLDDSPLLRRVNFAYMSESFAAKNSFRLANEIFKLSESLISKNSELKEAKIHIEGIQDHIKLSENQLDIERSEFNSKIAAAFEEKEKYRTDLNKIKELLDKEVGKTTTLQNKINDEININASRNEIERLINSYERVIGLIERKNKNQSLYFDQTVEYYKARMAVVEKRLRHIVKNRNSKARWMKLFGLYSYEEWDDYEVRLDSKTGKPPKLIDYIKDESVSADGFNSYRENATAPLAAEINNLKVTSFVDGMLADTGPNAFEFSEKSFKEYQRKNENTVLLNAESIPLVSIVVTSFNAESCIYDCIDSLLKQSYPNIEVIVCDDSSTDSTWQILEEIKMQCPSALKIIRLNENSGTYLAKNIAISESTGDIVMFQDSDDISHPSRIATQVEPLLLDVNLVATRTKYLRYNPDNNAIIPVADHFSKYGLITLAIRKIVFERIGYFDAVRKAGDDEFYQRICHFYNKSLVKHLDVTLYLAQLRDGSLIEDMLTFSDGKVNQSSSIPRKEYVNIFQNRFKKNEEKFFRNSFSPFPLRPNRIYPDSISSLDDKLIPVIVSVCCIPDREKSFKRVIDRLLPQVDRIYVFLDKFVSIPSYLQTNKKIFPILSSEFNKDYRDNAKFIPYNQLKKEFTDFYYFTCDDDILYPYEYTKSMISRIKGYSNKVVVGVHGVMYEEYPTKYFRRRFIYHFQNAKLSSPKIVNNLGTGTVAFHSSAFDSINPDTWLNGGMVDIYFSIECKVNKIPMICVDRHNNWLCETLESIGTDNLFTEFKNKDSLIVEELKKHKPWGGAAINNILIAQSLEVKVKLEKIVPLFNQQHSVSNYFSRFR